MLLCVAGGTSGFNRDRSREGARCSTQSTFLGNNANKESMVEERCSMTSEAVNVSSGFVVTQDSVCLDPRASRNAQNKHNENNLTHRGKVIVVRGDDAVSKTAETETCATTTTFRSNIVNGKRGTNTVLVRYKSSKALSQTSDDDYQSEFLTKKDGSRHTSVSSFSSTVSSESSSSKKDGISISAWAQIMELEGYRSPAIGLDNVPKRNCENHSDNESNDGSVSELSDSLKRYSNDTSDNGSSKLKTTENSCCYSNSCTEKIGYFNSSSFLNEDFNREDMQFSSIPVVPPKSNQFLTVNGEEVYSRSNWYDAKAENYDSRSAGYSKFQSTLSSNFSDKISEDSLTLHCSLPSEKNNIKVAQKIKSPMYRSESSRVPKTVHQEKSKSRRKTLPDGNLLPNEDNLEVIKSTRKKQISPEIDPNASWGKYNSKAMRDSVRKVAQKYAEVYLRRQCYSKLDALPEIKGGVQLTRYSSSHGNRDHMHSNSSFHCPSRSLYCCRVPSIPSHLHEVIPEPDIMLSSHRKYHLYAPASTHHDHNMRIKEYVFNCPHKRKETKTPTVCEKETRLDQSYSACMKDKYFSENESVISSSDKSSSISSQTNTSSCDSEFFCCDKGANKYGDICKYKRDYPMCKECSKPSTVNYNPSQSLCNSSVTKIEDSCINSDGSEENAFLSDRMRDIKSKLCVECAESAESGPPSKQPASRSKCHKINLSSPSSPNLCSSPSTLKRSPITVSDIDSSLSSHLHSLKKENNVRGVNSSSKHCTMLTAREMAELVHGSNSEKLNDNNRGHYIGVTSKVTSWIQKQKDKRKPVFFIGPSPTFFTSNYKENNVSEKCINRKSKRSLSLSNVREDNISMNCREIAESSLDLSTVETNPSIDDKNYDQKNLYIKRASSSCSNRGSARRKIRQGSPVRKERESVAKNFNYRTNQVDGCIVSWNNPENNNIHGILSLDNLTNKNDLNSEHDVRSNYKKDSLDESHYSLPSTSISEKKQRKNYAIAESKNESQEHQGKSTSDSQKLYSLDSSRQNLESLDTNKIERSSFSKKLLNIKHLTRALSLHSLKKKTKETSNEQNSDAPKSELTSSTHFSKWTRSSKRKSDNSKYGSLRKSLSYCELTVREANISGKSKSQVGSHTEIKSASKSSARTSVPLPKSVCCCSATPRRSVSLYFQFPLSRHQEYYVDDPKSDFLARLCVSRLCRRNGIQPFVRQIKNKKYVDKMKENVGPRIILENQSNHLDTSTRETTQPLPVIILKPDVLSKKNKCHSQKDILNGNEEKSSKSSVIMGLGSKHALNEASNCSSLKMVEEYIPFNGSSKTMENHLPVSVIKNKAPAGIKLRSKATSRSERHAKGKSTSELSGRAIRKTVSESDSKRRPTSQFYVLDEPDSKSDTSNGPNLLQMSNASCGSQPILSAPEETSEKLDGTPSCIIPRHLVLHTSTPHLSPADSLLQRFRKSFALRFQKKKPETVSSAPNQELLSTTVETPENISDSSDHVNVSESKDQEQINTHSESPSNTNNSENSHKPEETKHSPRFNSKQVHSCISDGRKKNKRKPDRRLSLICDSVDSIFDSTAKSPLNKCHRKPNFTGSDANILRKRAASTSDYSPKSKAIQRPVSVADYLTLDNTPCTKVPDGQNDLTRTASDTTSSEEQQKNLTSLDQIWRANPVKLCRVHSRLLTSRHKGRYRLRRSISQPVDLHMTGSVHNLRDSTHGSADHENFQKGSLSSDDEASSESDIYHSYCCSPSRRSNTCWELSGDGTMYAEAMWDYETIDPEELSLQAGDIIEVTDTSDQDWWWGTKDGNAGWFPSAFVRLYVSHRTPSLHFNNQQSDENQIPYSPCKVSMNNLSCEQVRANIVQEIVATERDYVKHLKDVVEGYLKQVQRRPDMFSKERIETVFGNIKEIYTFQSQFLKQLEECLDEDSPHLSQIGNCFLNHKEEFKMYSQYCNNHPLAVSELQELYCDSQYIHFFEACRLLQEMIDISLDGFLLTPIQRICKYPLQLAELLKFTDSNHPDHVPVTNALAAMRDVAELVNERKRRMECLERIAEWQNTIEGWEGPDVLDTSSILIHCGEVTRVSSSWSRDIYLFIFDHLLIYCKKDLLKRHTYAYKGRLNLDNCDIVDVEDGRDSQFAVNVKNAWKIYCKDKEKWYLFYAKTAPEKEQWLHAFKAERQRVIDDEKQAFVVTEEAKKSARLAVHNKLKPKRPRAKFTKGRRCHPDVAVTELLLDSPSAKARSGSLPSNIHPELAIMAGAKLGPTRKKGSGWFHFGSGKKPKS